MLVELLHIFDRCAVEKKGMPAGGENQEYAKEPIAFVIIFFLETKTMDSQHKDCRFSDIRNISVMRNFAADDETDENQKQKDSDDK